MKNFVLAAMLLATPAVAQEKPVAPPKPECGKTIKECQAAFDSQAKVIANLNQTVGLVAQQRDQIQQTLNNILVQQAVQAAPK